MLSRLRAKLNYANVVATLALFVALGGTGYAASQITSRDVKNRSLKGGDLRLNTVTGKEVNESKMGRVPSARQALNATNAVNADIAKSAGTAGVAGSAGTAQSAGVADIARDAQSLAGQGVGAFERSTRTQFGAASATPGGTSSEQTLFSWPELGVEVRSSSQDCGGSARFAVRSTKSAGGGNLQYFNNNQNAGSVTPGATARDCSPIGPDAVDAEVTDASGRTLFIDCVVGNGQLRCLGTRSEP